ncbi:hypothetical protein BDN72DRAFT_850173 [Pluteus cervinus]|uniref:Uncharacterized protein n=1 Tax=Pluteus cervinus TaxID=181527 RepID=A0ACD3A5U8_9AGAR|nr:hypothetical protein BDN72DRAFT_850173 [Pluteus cervinus]
MDSAIARDKIDAEIAALKERIRALRTERNRLAPISRCPPNVLTDIFTWLQQLYIPGLHARRKWFPAARYLKWTRVTHVSQHWRQIGLSPNSKSLWSVIPFGRLAYATESFNRLGSRPIYLIGPMNMTSSSCVGSDNSPLWASIASECHRIQFIHDVVGSTLANFDKPMPLLEHVTIQSKCALSPSIISPSLRTLVLSKCDFSWNYWPVLPHLTTLDIEDPAQRVSFDSFMVILFGCPRLNHLDIENIFPTSTSSQPHDLKPVEPSPLLPRLSSLHASESPFSSELFCRLRFTRNFSMIDLDAGKITTGSVPVIMQALNRILRESSKAIPFANSRDSPFIKLKFDPWNEGERDMSNCAECFSTLPLDTMEELETNVFDTPKLWEGSILGRLPSLRKIHMDDTGQVFFEHLAKDYKKFSKSNGQGSLSFASLHEVKMYGTHFTHKLKKLVSTVLAGRDKAGYRLKTFYAFSSTGEIVEGHSDEEFEKYVDKLEISIPQTRCPRRRQWFYANVESFTSIQPERGRHAGFDMRERQCVILPGLPE